MSVMIGKLLLNPRTATVMNTIMGVVGIVLVIAVRDNRLGTVVFLSVTALESGAFSLLYGLRSSWWREPAARAIFWTVLAYFALSSVVLIGGFLFPRRYGWFPFLRELGYLGLSVAGLNLVLTLLRVLGRDPRSRL